MFRLVYRNDLTSEGLTLLLTDWPYYSYYWQPDLTTAGLTFLQVELRY